MDQYIPNPDEQDATAPPLRCHVCGRTASWDEAVEGGWMPDFWLPDGTCSTDPACPDCTVKHLRRGAEGEYEVR